MIKKIKQAYRNLELHKGTKDVKDDLRLLAIKDKVKNQTFYLVMAISAIGLIVGIKLAVMSDSFRASLILVENKHILLTFFEDRQLQEYIDNKALYNKVKAKHDELLKTMKSNSVIKKNYSQGDFLAQITEDKIDLSKTINESKAFATIKKYYTISKLANDVGAKIKIRENEYSRKEILEKLKTITDQSIKTTATKEAIKAAAQTFNIKEDEMQDFENAFLNQKITDQDVVFYTQLKKIDIKERILEAIKNGKKKVYLKAAGLELPGIVLPDLTHDFELAKAKNASEQEEIYRVYLENKEKMQAELDRYKKEAEAHMKLAKTVQTRYETLGLNIELEVLKNYVFSMHDELADAKFVEENFRQATAVFKKNQDVSDDQKLSDKELEKMAEKENFLANSKKELLEKVKNKKTTQSEIKVDIFKIMEGLK